MTNPHGLPAGALGRNHSPECQAAMDAGSPGCLCPVAATPRSLKDLFFQPGVSLSADSSRPENERYAEKQVRLRLASSLRTMPCACGRMKPAQVTALGAAEVAFVDEPEIGGAGFLAGPWRRCTATVETECRVCSHREPAAVSVMVKLRRIVQG